MRYLNWSSQNEITWKGTKKFVKNCLFLQLYNIYLEDTSCTLMWFLSIFIHVFDVLLSNPKRDYAEMLTYVQSPWNGLRLRIAPLQHSKIWPISRARHSCSSGRRDPRLACSPSPCTGTYHLGMNNVAESKITLSAMILFTRVRYHNVTLKVIYARSGCILFPYSH